MSLLDREFCDVCGVEKSDKGAGHNDSHTGTRKWWCSEWCLERPSVEVQQAKLLLIRGLPGSGKSSMARSVFQRGYFDVHLEADMFHMERGKYVYKPGYALAAHSWCLSNARVYLNNDKRVVVSNTFVLLEQLRPYMELGFPFYIVEARGSFGSTHNVPDEVMDHMRKRWQPIL